VRLVWVLPLVGAACAVPPAFGLHTGAAAAALAGVVEVNAVVRIAEFVEMDAVVELAVLAEVSALPKTAALHLHALLRGCS